jgi:hypothetical protein
LSVVSLLFFSAVRTLDDPTTHLLLWWEGYTILLTGLIAVQSDSSGGVAVGGWWRSVPSVG